MHVVLFHKRTLVSMIVSLSLFSLNSYSKTKDNTTDLGQIQVADNLEKINKVMLKSMKRMWLIFI